MIGGNDLTLWRRDDLPVADMVLRVVRRYWPDCVFQDANEESYTLCRSMPWLSDVMSSDFFVYQNETAAKSWEEHGAIPENANTMLYVMNSEYELKPLGLRAVTLVYSDLTGQMKDIVEEIQLAFQDHQASLAPVSKWEAA